MAMSFQILQCIALKYPLSVSCSELKKYPNVVLIIHKHEQIFDASFKSKIMFMKALYTLTVVITCIIFHANAYSQGNYFAATNFGSHSKEVNYTGVDKESLASPEMGFIGKEIEKTVTVIKDGFDGINEPKCACSIMGNDCIRWSLRSGYHL